MTGLHIVLGDRLVGPVLGQPEDLVWLVADLRAGLVELECESQPGRSAVRSKMWTELWMTKAA